MPHNDARQQILRLFMARQGAFISGAELSRELGVSRAAVWKQIESLRALGYRIEAARSHGYRLQSSPDRLSAEDLSARLQTRIVGRELVCFEETDSTNLQALRLGEQGASEGTVLVAESQRGGKGRLGRHWLSPSGVNLYTSIILRPRIPPWDAPQLTFLSAVAVARAVQQVCGLPARVKWPNDILINGRKVAGLLNELSAETDAVHFVVLGIGLNINMRADQIPASLRYPATSLAIELERPLPRAEVACAVYRQLDDLYRLYLNEGFDPIRLAWEACFDLVGEKVRVESGERTLTGIVQGIDTDGALLVGSAGTVERILAGDVVPVG
ncbi:biotin--[acetyl-CoA-carboxylase] ligase [Geothermobacter hydrogeniphilus]|uniref:Bifunctional ligase/repressor BirA n=1 Tax=Geothermobacter hydrogeniphilus TaxID=1969733 RepID=A0A2K2HAR8_9BACT|nr:biotin--[acetyl-CoA-carboxylase] ligase [Geothermobacter hydrogeniphilus]PNU20323.1 biotin--[acetyl-CoA-carboxylase] ligase [Geothermobacter hydrogeniphilus]